MKKKILTVLIITLLAMCNYMNVFAQETIKTKETVAEPRIVYYGSETSLDAVFSVWLNDEHIPLGTGYMSSTLEEAITNPLVIESAGHSIYLLLENIDPYGSEEIILHPGYVGSINFNENYLYIIVSGESIQEVSDVNEVSEECEEEKLVEECKEQKVEDDGEKILEEIEEEKVQLTSAPEVIKKSSYDIFMTSYGTYCVSAEGYGVLCSGNLYKDPTDALKDPLVIDSKGYELKITISTRGRHNKSFNISSGYTELITPDRPHDQGSVYVQVL